ncbi:hypothetical protein LDO26_05620 [Luteimonas sp. BDR2-5]|uniref:hypothetical protein n=1 Tax=Proluteimonas luteida TaxID=2878685 RepID=UPI001E4D40C1|nr:hypothetical protein [Luteimonas sp. BDR2-5]MCD9027685.1 hypothetical protein [Luteimonas sp. BDR2-5]
MSSRAGAAGATRTCPHCKTTILKSAARCPSCMHYLRFDEAASPAAVKARQTTSALHVEGKIRHPDEGGAWEYAVVVVIRDETGKEINRHVVGVGALFGGDERTFSLSVEVTPTNDMRRPARAPVKRGIRH